MTKQAIKQKFERKGYKLSISYQSGKVIIYPPAGRMPTLHDSYNAAHKYYFGV